MNTMYSDKKFFITIMLGAVFLVGGHTSPAEAFSVRGGGDEGRGERVQMRTFDRSPVKTAMVQRPFLYIEQHTEGQVSDETLYLDGDDMPLLAFSLRPRGTESVELSELSLRLVVARGLTLDEVSNIRLYRTAGLDTLSEDDLVGGGVLSQGRGSRGTIAFAFTEALSLDGATDFLVVADLSGSGERAVMNIGLQSRGVLAEGSVRTVGSVVVTHHLGRKPVDDDDGGGDDDGSGGGGDDGGGSDENNADPSGGDRPSEQNPGAGDTTGGTSGGSTPSEDGETIGNEPGFYAPTVSGGVANRWANGENALVSNDTYATSGTAEAQQTYSNFNVLEIPSTNTVTGITVKLEASATSEGGTISVAVSWDGGFTFSEPRTTGTLTTTDAVYTLGGPSDTWGGRVWTPSDFSNENLVVRITANLLDNNTLRLDAIQIAPHHQATGGGNTVPGRF